MKTGPCKNCQKRFVGCHNQCLEYIDWRQQLDVLKQQKDESAEWYEYQSNKRKHKKAR